MRKGLLVGAVAGVIAVAAISLLFSSGVQITQSPKPTREITIIGGELDIKGPYGFSLGDGKLSSPGLMLTLKVGERVKVTFKNVGQIPHTFNIVREAKENADSIWGASIGTAGAPLDPGRSRSVEFTPRDEGEFFYVCLVRGHISAFKMFGKVVVGR